MAAKYDRDIWQDYWTKPGKIETDPIPLGVVVTVAGTGSECNGGAVITNEKKTLSENLECRLHFQHWESVIESCLEK